MDATALIDALKIWLTPGSQANQEPAYFRDKTLPLIPDIVETLSKQHNEIRSLSRDYEQTLKTHRAEVDNLRARADMLSRVNSGLTQQLADQQPEIDRLKATISAVKLAVQNG